MPTALLVTGRTIILRRDLKALRGRWRPDLQAWLVPMSRRPGLDALAKTADIEVDLYDPATGRVARLPRPWMRQGKDAATTPPPVRPDG
jgi:hypothetical protein